MRSQLAAAASLTPPSANRLHDSLHDQATRHGLLLSIGSVIRARLRAAHPDPLVPRLHRRRLRSSHAEKRECHRPMRQSLHEQDAHGANSRARNDPLVGSLQIQRRLGKLEASRVLRGEWGVFLRLLARLISPFPPFADPSCFPVRRLHFEKRAEEAKLSLFTGSSGASCCASAQPTASRALTPPFPHRHASSAEQPCQSWTAQSAQIAQRQIAS